MEPRYWKLVSTKGVGLGDWGEITQIYSFSDLVWDYNKIMDYELL